MSNTTTPPEPPPGLERAGRMLEDTVQAMLRENIQPQLIASALLGGALHMLTRALNEDAVVRILQNAIAGVKSGQMRPPAS